MGDDMSTYKDVFLSESADYIQGIIDGLLALESNPGDLEPVETVFRGAHSLKGMAAAMGYDKTAELTHKMESLMDTVRKGEQQADVSLIDLMLKAVDTVKALVDFEASGGEEVDLSGVMDEIEARTDAKGPLVDAGGSTPPSPAQHEQGLGLGEKAYHIIVTLEESCVLKSVRAYMVLKRFNHMGTVTGTVPSTRAIEDEEFDQTFEVFLRTEQEASHIRDAVMGINEVMKTKVDEITAGISEGETTGGRPDKVRESNPKKPKTSQATEAQTVRVSIAHLDNMVNLVGELVIVRSRLENLTGSMEHKGIHEALEEFHRVTGELQHGVMQTRMVPVGNIFNRFPRMVRDLSRDLGKQVAFEMDGLGIELDRTVLDEIGDPIVHMLRNAIDHGIESPEDRAEAGKSENGSVQLIARRERDMVEILVTDDGRGMDLERIFEKAVEKGLARVDERESLSDRDLLALTCAPGFSTSKQTTRVSGRGVGMDVVKGKIEYLGGSLMIHTELGKGSEFVLTLPLTLAIIQALLVRCSNRIFVIPLSAVSEVVPPDEMRLGTVDGSQVMHLASGDVIPLYKLVSLIGLDEDSPSEHFVLLDIDGQVRALGVQELIGRQEIVIKPLSRMFRHLRGLGGATVLGDGSIALILDPRSLFEMGGS